MKTDIETAICILEDISTEYGGRTVDNVLANLRAIQAHREAKNREAGSSSVCGDKTRHGANMRVKADACNIGDIFNLPCVLAVQKALDGEVSFKIRNEDFSLSWAKHGDWLICKDGKWRIEKSGKS